MFSRPSGESSEANRSPRVWGFQVTESGRSRLEVVTLISAGVTTNVYLGRLQGVAGFEKQLVIKRIGADNILFATEMFGAINAIDPKTGRNFEDIVPIFQSIEWLSDEDRYKITEGNARTVYSRAEFDRTA